MYESILRLHIVILIFALVIGTYLLFKRMYRCRDVTDRAFELARNGSVQPAIRLLIRSTISSMPTGGIYSSISQRICRKSRQHVRDALTILMDYEVNNDNLKYCLQRLEVLYGHMEVLGPDSPIIPRPGTADVEWIACWKEIISLRESVNQTRILSTKPRSDS